MKQCPPLPLSGADGRSPLQSGSNYFDGTWKVHLDVADSTWAAPLPFTDYVVFAAGHWFMDVSEAAAPRVLAALREASTPRVWCCRTTFVLQ